MPATPRTSAVPPGHSEQSARSRLQQDGPNELAADASTSFLRSALEVVREPMLLLLLAAGAIYFALGSARDALTLMVAVLAMIGLALFQKRKTEHAVSQLKQLSAPQARVIRDGSERAIPTREIVHDDVVLVREGDRVPADAVVLESSNLRVDESLLTGESVPVDKLAGSLDQPLLAPEAGARALVYGGTLVVQGHGTALVRATGPRSAMGRIGTALSGTQRRASPLQIEVQRLVRVIALLGLGLCLVLALAYVITQHDPMRGILAGITLAMSILPEELPVVLTVFTTLGAFRIAKQHVLARRSEAIEALGSATVLCVDKTGTITENRMRIAVLAPLGAAAYDVSAHPDGPLPEEVHLLLEYGRLASQPASPDPMERAFHELGAAALGGTEHLRTEYTREQEYPLTHELLAVTHLFRTQETHGHVVAAKGAPEAIADLCHLATQAKQALLDQAGELARRGLRVLAVARARHEPAEHPSNPHDFAFEVVGLVGLEDPVRASVPAATAEFRRAGVRVVMITGDHADTARAIAEKAGLDVGAGVITGAELDRLDESARRASVARVNVFARCNPEHKLHLISAFAAAGELIAMTGDGVNDAPALKAAHIGIAMGLRGTDVAREAAALVLATEDFGAIAHAIVLGRRVFENMRKAMGYVLAVHVPIAGMALTPVLLGMPALLFPVHLVFLELVIDPACTIALEAEEPDIDLAAQRPGARGRRLLTRRDVLTSVLQGLALWGAVFAVYAYALARALAEDQARALGFICIVVGNLALILVQRSTRRSALATLIHARNPFANLLSCAALGLLLTALYVPWLRTLFHFALPPLTAGLGAAGAGLAAGLWYDLVKLTRKRRPRTPSRGSH